MMENISTRKKLPKAPIKEVSIGISMNGLFNAPEDLDMFYNNFSLKDKYSNREPLKSITFEVGAEPKVIENASQGSLLSNSTKDEIIHIESNRLMFIDRTIYSDFDTFWGKFTNITDSLCETFKKEIEIFDISLRYVNNFSLPISNLHDYFRILPMIATVENEDCFANTANYLAAANIISSFDGSVQANVKTFFNALSQNKLNIVFDIDAHDIKPCKMCSSKDLEGRLLFLKDFKNKIFFSNFVDAYEIEDFK